MDQSADPLPPFKSSSVPWWRSIRNVSFAAMSVSCVLIGLVGSRYLVPRLQHTLPPPIVDNAFARPFLYIHIACAIPALVLGPLQFVTSLRRRYPAVHRVTGRVYVVCCLVGGVAALPVALHSFAGPIAQVGLVSLSVSWLAINSNAWRLAVAGRISEHKRWMIRSFAVTFGAVTLRVMLGLLPALGVPLMTTYRFGAWASWVPNLLVVEAWMRYNSTAAGGDAKSERLLAQETPRSESSAAGPTVRRKSALL